MRTAVLILALLVPISLWAHPDPDKDKHCRPERDRHCAVSVPEGGTPLGYLLVAGSTIGFVLLLNRKYKYRGMAS
jgi:hypothetical protein